MVCLKPRQIVYQTEVHNIDELKQWLLDVCQVALAYMHTDVNA